MENFYCPDFINFKLLSIEDSNKTIKEKYFDTEWMPKMYVDDPIAKHFNAEIGQVFKIRRVLGDDTYRIVVNKNTLNEHR